MIEGDVVIKLHHSTPFIIIYTLRELHWKIESTDTIIVIFDH